MPNPTALPMDNSRTDQSTVFRVDRFTCPLAHWPAFAERLAFIDSHLRRHKDCIFSRVATSKRDGMVFVITLAEWINREALLMGKQEMAAVYAANDFDPAAFLAEHGITGEFATFETLFLSEGSPNTA